MISAVVAFVLLASGAPDVPVRQPTIKQADGDSLARKLAEMERLGSRKRPPVLVTEAEATSYLNLNVAAKLPPGLSQPVLRFERDRISASGFVDLEVVKGKVALPAANGSINPLMLLSGKVPFQVTGRLENQDGFATFEIEEVRLGTWPLPITMVEQVVATATRSAQRPGGVELHAPFRLPYSVNRIRLEPGRAWLAF
jgi:hypothetical protein